MNTIRNQTNNFTGNGQCSHPAYILLYSRGTLQNIVGLRAAMSSISFILSCTEMLTNQGLSALKSQYCQIYEANICQEVEFLHYIYGQTTQLILAITVF